MERKTYFSSSSSSSSNITHSMRITSSTSTTNSNDSINYLYRNTCQDTSDRPCTKTYTNYVTNGTELKKEIFTTPYREYDGQPVHSSPEYVAAMASKIPKNPKDTTTFEAECLEEHNIYRARHGVPPLTLNRKLCTFAHSWAQELAKNNKMEHRKNNKYGENLYMACGKEINGKTAVKAWYNEIKNYSFKKASFDMNSGHFTQVIWKNSTQLGIGSSKNGASTYVVCNYDPPGNYTGQFGENVPAPL